MFRKVGILAAVASLAASGLYAQTTCSLATLSGTYTTVASGNVWNANNLIYIFSAVGQIAADGIGNVVGADTASTSGLVQIRNYVGIYSVNPDCSGSLVWSIQGAFTHLNFVLSLDGKTVRFIQTDAGTVVSGTAERQPASPAVPTAH